jgi:hypothetical protein
MIKKFRWLFHAFCLKMVKSVPTEKVARQDLTPMLAPDPDACPRCSSAISEISGLIYFYQWGNLISGPKEILLFMTSLAVASVGSVVLLLAVAEGLKMGRDVANNSRAMREYLRRLAGR